MKRVTVLIHCLLWGATFLIAPNLCVSQDITVHVWKLDKPNQPAASLDDATIEVTQAIRTGSTEDYFESITSGSAQRLASPPPAIDLVIFRTGYHPLVIHDLSVAPERNQVLNVQLLSQRYPINAPECLALKTSYELLFRKEQQRTPNAASEDVEHRARLKYADGILALPNPNHMSDYSLSLQPPGTRMMLEKMDQADDGSLNELDGMIEGLFDLFEMDQFEHFVPSKWDTSYWVGAEGQERKINAAVELLGTHGTYKVGGGTHLLESIDITYDNQSDAVIIEGKFRFKPNTADEKVGQFRWQIDEDGRTFHETRSQRPGGGPSWVGTMVLGPDDGE